MNWRCCHYFFLIDAWGTRVREILGAFLQNRKDDLTVILLSVKLCELGLIGKVTHKARAEHWAHRSMRPKESHLSACWLWHPPLPLYAHFLLHRKPSKPFTTVTVIYCKELVLLSKVSHSVKSIIIVKSHLDHWGSSIFNQNTDLKLSAIQTILWEREKGMRSSRTQLLKLLTVNPHGAP